MSRDRSGEEPNSWSACVLLIQVSPSVNTAETGGSALEQALTGVTVIVWLLVIVLAGPVGVMVGVLVRVRVGVAERNTSGGR